MEIKGMQIGKIKVSWRADDMTAYISDPEDSNGELLQLINTFSKELDTKLTHNIGNPRYK